MDASRVADGLLAMAEARGLQLDGDLEQAERLLREVALEAGSQALEKHLGRQKLGYDGAQRCCPSCDRWQRFIQHRPRAIVTLLGEVCVKRAYYRCDHCGCTSLPWDEQVGLARTCASTAVAQAATWCAAQVSFGEAATTLSNLSGVNLSRSTVHRLTQRVGQAAQHTQAVDAPQTFEVEAEPNRLYTAVDGTMAHIDGDWREVRAAVCYWENEQGEHESRCCARHDSAKAFVPYVEALARRCGHHRTSDPVLLGDGAKWIWRHIGAALRPDTTHITDWYHVMQQVWSCARALHGEASPRAKAWVEPIQTMLWEGRLRDLRRHLRQQLAACEDDDHREAVRVLLGYINHQGDRLVYDDFRAAGYDIGSGPVESACGHVVAHRVKRPGMRWSHDGIQATLALRTTYLNHHHPALWATNPLRSHLRN